MSLWRLAVCFVLGYLLGNIQPGLLLSLHHAKVDLRKVGSGGTGATNTMRVLGTKFALLTLAIDVGKGALAAWIGSLLAGETGSAVCAVAAVMGHVWPVFYRFRGGKGVSTSLGAILVLTPLYGVLVLAIALIVMVLFRYVSLGSLVGSGTYLILAVITAIREGRPALAVFAVLAVGLIFFAHRQNIRRLISRSERKVNFKH